MTADDLSMMRFIQQQSDETGMDVETLLSNRMFIAMLWLARESGVRPEVLIEEPVERLIDLKNICLAVGRNEA